MNPHRTMAGGVFMVLALLTDAGAAERAVDAAHAHVKALVMNRAAQLRTAPAHKAVPGFKPVPAQNGVPLASLNGVSPLAKSPGADRNRLSARPMLATRQSQPRGPVGTTNSPRTGSRGFLEGIQVHPRR